MHMSVDMSSELIDLSVCIPDLTSSCSRVTKLRQPAFADHLISGHLVWQHGCDHVAVASSVLP